MYCQYFKRAISLMKLKLEVHYILDRYCCLLLKLPDSSHENTPGFSCPRFPSSFEFGLKLSLSDI